MDADRLLRELESMPFTERQRRISQVAGSEAGTDGWRPLLNELLGRGWYERRVGLLLASVARDLDYVRACMSVGGPSERARALNEAVRLGIDPAELVAALPALSAAARRALIRAVRRHGIPPMADALMSVLRGTWGLSK